MTTSPPTALTIAGSDSGGAAGLQADLRTFLTCGVHGLVAVTAVTVQNTLGVHDRADLPPHIVAGQIEAVAADMGVGAAKTGMLASAEIIDAVAAACDKAEIGRDEKIPFVVDPVAASMHGHPLFDDAGLRALRDELLPRATVLTPNLDEVRLLTGMTVKDREGMHTAAVVLHRMGPRYVLVKRPPAGGPGVRRPALRRLDVRGAAGRALPDPAHARRGRHDGVGADGGPGEGHVSGGGGPLRQVVRLPGGRARLPDGRQGRPGLGLLAAGTRRALSTRPVTLSSFTDP